MRRRGITVVVGALVTALLAIGVMVAPLPYVLLRPGPTVNTLGSDNGKEVIKITGATTSTSAGQLRLTTVGVQPEVELIWAIRGWFSDEDAVVPRELVYGANENKQKIEQRNAEDFKASQSSAETAALRELGYPVQVVVRSVLETGPAQSRLRVGDTITSVDGAAVSGAARLTELIGAKPVGSELSVGYIRNGTAGTARIKTAAQGAEKSPRIGIGIEQKQPHPFTISIDVGDIGGPSAGLMFALGIIDKIRPEDLTGGKIISGTGAITDDGNIGAVGGIGQKLRGAKAAGSRIFLVPAENCPEAVNNPVPGLTLARVATLDEALAALKTYRDGGTPTSCSST